jgi:3'(2'), 5'-bisphosphate nucleotidase
MTHDRSSQGCRIEVKGLLVIALGAAFDAGDRILEIYNSNFNVWYKGDASPLTEADRCSHEIISRHLSETSVRSDDRFPVLSEEGKDIPYEERRRWQHFWLVDPLDGTKEFVKRNGEFTVNIALIEEDIPVIGLIYVPVKDTLYFAARELGSYRSKGSDVKRAFGRELREGEHGDIVYKLTATSVRLPYGNEWPRRPLTIVGSRSHATREQEEYIEEMKKKSGEVQVISAGSSLKFCLIAEGCADIYPRFGPTMEWDTAAGQCIVEASGGEVLSFPDNLPLRYNKMDLKNDHFIAKTKQMSGVSRNE